MAKQPIILKIGGSLLSPSAEQLFDFTFAYDLKGLLQELAQQGFTFALNVGGGYVTRMYQKMVGEHGEQDIEDIHKVGIATTNLNSEIVHGLLGNLVQPQLINYKAYEDFVSGQGLAADFDHYPVLMLGPAKPGHSNDWNALQVAKRLQVTRVFDVKNVAGVFTADPHIDAQATLLPKLSWQEYLNVIGNPTEHKPGANYPVDPLAAAEARQAGVEFVIVGNDIANLRAAIAGDDFTGTTISG